MLAFFVGAALGAPWVLSFAPMSLWWLGLLLVSVLPFVTLRTSRPILAGLAFGWSAYGVGVSWLHISLHTYGGLPSMLAWAAIAAFTFYLAVAALYLVLTSVSLLALRFLEKRYSVGIKAADL